MVKGNNKFNVSRPIFFVSVLFVALVVFVVINLSVVFIDGARDRSNLDLSADLRALSYRVSGLSRDATNGEDEAFGELNGVLNQMEAGWKELREHGDELPAETLSAYDETLTAIATQAKSIISDKDTILFLNQVVVTLNERLPQLQEEHTQVVEILLDGHAPSDQVAVAQAQSWRAERIGRNVDKMLAGGGDAEAAADQFNQDANLFGRVLDGMKKGDRALGIGRVTDRRAAKNLSRIAGQFEFVSNSVQEIFDATPALFRARQATENILDQTPTLLENGAGISDAITALPSSRLLSNNSALVAGILAAILLALIGMQIYAGTRRSLKDTALANEKNQQAILRLLDEIEGLGDGDLTAEATVTADFTGAIADAINFAILQLRELVSQIQDTAENVSAAANETRATALQLADASSHQADEITGASVSINEMANTIDQVSSNAAESALVAQRSVTIAANGASVVQSNIQGMDTIREQIQDTSKRIKRLGESSQEIGDIVSLMSDIADQTNILALNAAIQASMAGDAGRGFAVVADEVQRLAERSAGAAKQVASLVKAIQTDTNEAVSSMEQTTSEVVKGAQLAQDAGAALEEIEGVSGSLSELIHDISTTARDQATMAGQISSTMTVIQDITSQTLSGTNNTASSIGELAEMAVELREFVADFKLPEDMPSAVVETDSADLNKRSFNVFSATSAEGEDALEEAMSGQGIDLSEPEDEAKYSYEASVDGDDSSESIEEEAFAESIQPTVTELEAELGNVDLDEFSVDEEPKK